MIRTAIMLCVSALLIGCATPEPPIRTVHVNVPVAVPCAVALPSAPVYAISAVSLAESDVDVWIRAYQATIEQAEAYIDQLKAATKGCQA